MDFLYKFQVKSYVDYTKTPMDLVHNIVFEKVKVVSKVMSETTKDFVSAFILEDGEEVSVFDIQKYSSTAEYNEYVKIGSALDEISQDGFVGTLYFTEERVNYHGLDNMKDLLILNFKQQFDLEDFSKHNYYSLIIIAMNTTTQKVVVNIKSLVVKDIESNGTRRTKSKFFSTPVMDIAINPEASLYKILFKENEIGKITSEEISEDIFSYSVIRTDRVNESNYTEVVGEILTEIEVANMKALKKVQAKALLLSQANTHISKK